MAQITNAELKRQLDELSAFVKERIEKVEQRVDMIEQQSLPILKRVDDFFAFWRKAVTHLKRIGYFIAAAIVTQLVAWLIFHLLGH